MCNALTFKVLQDSIFGCCELQINIKSDKSFIIEEFNYFFDNFENKKEPIIIKGELSESEFSKIKTIIENANLYTLDDSYGRNSSEITTSKTNDLTLQTYITSGKGDKWTSVLKGNIDKLPSHYAELLEQMNIFISSQKK